MWRPRPSSRLKSMVFWVITRRRVVIILLNNYHTTPCNKTEDHRFHEHRGGSLKYSRLFVRLL